MDVGEAARQYQAMLEAQRRTRSLCEGLVSMLDAVDDAASEVAASRRQLRVAWADDRLARMTAAL